MRISDWSSDVCSSDLIGPALFNDEPNDRPRRPESRQRKDRFARAGRIVPVARVGDRRRGAGEEPVPDGGADGDHGVAFDFWRDPVVDRAAPVAAELSRGVARSEEHTSELQSLMRISYAVFCL